MAKDPNDSSNGAQLNAERIARVISANLDPKTREAVELLGRSLIAWSYLELCVDTLLLAVLSLKGLWSDAGDLIVANLDIREKASITVALGCVASLPKSTKADIVTSMNRVQNELRNERNRLFHDSWRVGEGGLSRRKTTGTKVVRPQARALSLELPAEEPVSVEAIRAFVEKCFAETERVLELCNVALSCAEAIPPLRLPEPPPRPRKFWNRLLQHFR